MKQLNRKQTNFLDLAIYSVMFYIILLPFYEIGWLKIGSIALILAFFAGILNRFLREWYDVKINVGKTNRVIYTGKQHDPGEEPSRPTEYFNDIPSRNRYVEEGYNRPPGERAPD